MSTLHITGELASRLADSQKVGEAATFQVSGIIRKIEVNLIDVTGFGARGLSFTKGEPTVDVEIEWATSI